MKPIEEIESAETKRCRGLVIQREAELDQAKAALTEARKAQWKPVHKWQLAEIAGTLDCHFRALTSFDWERGTFDYAEWVVLQSSGVEVYIGGYVSNDRFRNEKIVFVPAPVVQQFNAKATQDRQVKL